MGTGDLPCPTCGNYWCAGHYPVQPVYPTVPLYPTGISTTTLKWPPDPARLHPDDIEAIAKRVVELLKAAAPTQER